MPELPEIETILNGLKPHLENNMIQEVIVRSSQLRWPIPSDLNQNLKGQKILHLSRRGKYLVIEVTSGTLLIHLGMSGSLKILTQSIPPSTHDHVDILLMNHQCLRYHDPRRFGALLWTVDNPLEHPLLKSMGIEPLTADFTGTYLKQRSLNRHTSIKTFIMNGRIVAGIGNIYATEALFLAKIHPCTPANILNVHQYDRLVVCIKNVLTDAISSGGTTLKDFVDSEGKPGYFIQKLQVYGRAGLPCVICKSPLQSIKLGQRTTVFCKKCQFYTSP